MPDIPSSIRRFSVLLRPRQILKPLEQISHDVNMGLQEESVSQVLDFTKVILLSSSKCVTLRSPPFKIPYFSRSGESFLLKEKNFLKYSPPLCSPRETSGTCRCFEVWKFTLSAISIRRTLALIYGTCMKEHKYYKLTYTCAMQ